MESRLFRGVGDLTGTGAFGMNPHSPALPRDSHQHPWASPSSLPWSSSALGSEVTGRVRCGPI